MVRPEKRIHTEADLQLFLSSRQFAELWAYMLQLNNAVINKKCSDVSLSEASTNVKKLVEMLCKLEEWVHHTPPVKQPSRFGNKAYRTWHSRLVDQSGHLMASLVAESKDETFANAINTTLESLSEELAEYLSTSFGNETRIDYGSGHEAHFLVLLFCLRKVGVFTDDDDEAMVLLVFPAYLRVTRLLQKIYMLEPAGSHGVWGLDDYCFLPFLWGSAQLRDNRRIGAADLIMDDVLLRENREEYLYADAIAMIKEVKSGPFHEHSPMLTDISQVKAGWPKINQGMIKMYKGEVWAKRQVIQHFLFGRVFTFGGRQFDQNGKEVTISTLGTTTHN